MALELISRSAYRPVQGDVPVVCPVKNERGLLPHFIRHHRALGVENFIFIDNASNDGTTEFLLAEPGCTVYRTADSFAAANFGMDWINTLLTENAAGRWALYLDCDELLVFEDMETNSLDRFLEAYGRDGTDSFYAMMVDMYPEGAWAGVSAKTTASIAEALNCFDKDYIVRRRPDPPWRSTDPGAIEVLGGPRCRLFSTLDRDAAHGWPYYVLAGQVDRFIDRVPIGMMPTLARLWPRGMQALFKTPLNLVGDGFGYTYSHGSTNRKKGRSMLAILHLKFCDELNARFDPVFSYENHYRRGLERFQLAAAMERLGDRSLHYSGTRQFTSSRSLVDVDIIGERPAAVWTEGARRFRTGT